MDSFNEELLLAREWLVKVDAHASTPYLMKFHSSPVDLTCSVMITDTKRTWAEALSSNQFARRWRECNKRIDSPPLDGDEEDAWRTRTFGLLSTAHTLGGMLELSFEVVESKFGDFTFELECNAFKWRWETIFLGHKVSAEILSKHLIIPLISANHLAFSCPDVISNLPPTDLEKAIDKVARTARRTVDIHVKNAFSKPRLATTIRRITAVFNFISEPPSITIDASSAVLLPPPEPTPKIKQSPGYRKDTRTLTPEPDDRRDLSTNSKRESVALSHGATPINRAAGSGSATEPEDDSSIQHSIPTTGAGVAGADQQHDMPMRSPTPSREASPRAAGRSRPKAPPSDTDSSPVRPIKKSKPRVLSSDEDSEEGRKKVAAQIRRGTVPASASGPGLRQPIKRGGKRF